MANRTAKDAATVKGTNPQFLVEKIIRQRIYDSLYWKEHCFALTAELIVDKGMDLRYVGGIYGGNVKPTPFLCLSLKLLQIQPDKDIIVEFIRQEDFKYIRALGAMYLRLTFSSVEIYKYLEPLYNDYRKLRYMNKQGRYEMVYMDEFIDQLLNEERYCDIQLPRLQKREALEEIDELVPYVSALDEDLDKLSESDSDEEEVVKKKEKPRLISKRRSRSRSKERQRDRSLERMREKERGGDARRDRDRDDRRDERGGERDSRRGGEERESRRDREDREGRRERDEGGRRDRDRGDRDRKDDRDRSDRHHRESRREDRDRRDKGDRDRKEKEKDGGRKRQNDEQREIDEANALRAKLGLAPLQV